MYPSQSSDFVMCLIGRFCHEMFEDYILSRIPFPNLMSKIFFSGIGKVARREGGKNMRDVYSRCTDVPLLFCLMLQMFLGFFH